MLSQAKCVVALDPSAVTAVLAFTANAQTAGHKSRVAAKSPTKCSVAMPRRSFLQEGILDVHSVVWRAAAHRMMFLKKNL